MPMLHDAIDQFLKVDRSAHTNRQYRRVLTKLCTAIGPQRRVGLVTYADLLDYTANLRPTVQPSTFGTYTLVIKAFFSWVAHSGYAITSPAAHLIARTPPRDPMEERAIPLEHLAEMRRYAYPTPRYYAVLLFLMESAARVGGAATLRLSRLNLDECEASLLEKGRQYVTVFFGDETADAIRRWLQVRPITAAHDYVWTHKKQPTRLEVPGLTEIIQTISLRACGIKYGPHRLRHHVAQTWEAAGCSPYDIQHKLNHASARTTQDHYLLNQHPAVKQLSRKLSAAVLGSPPDRSNGKILYLDDCG
jgi:site-specific recombinase XerD